MRSKMCAREMANITGTSCLYTATNLCIHLNMNKFLVTVTHLDVNESNWIEWNGNGNGNWKKVNKRRGRSSTSKHVDCNIQVKKFIYFVNIKGTATSCWNLHEKKWADENEQHNMLSSEPRMKEKKQETEPKWKKQRRENLIVVNLTLSPDCQMLYN